jgi:hypothetical protein
MADDKETDAIEIEAAWFDEFATALESNAAEYRRAARLWRFGGRALSPAVLADYRDRLHGVARRTIATSVVHSAFDGDEKGGVKP